MYYRQFKLKLYLCRKNYNMSFEIEGSLQHVLEEQSGESQRGPWKKRSFVIETSEQYPKKVHFVAWNDKTDILDRLKDGEKLRVNFVAESREYNGRWYTDLKVLSISSFSSSELPAQPKSQIASPPPPEDEPLTPLSFKDNATDDLPF